MLKNDLINVDPNRLYLLSPEEDNQLNAGEHKLIYIISHPGVSYHEGRLKVGDVTIHTDKKPYAITTLELETAARKRIDSDGRGSGGMFRQLLR